MDLLRSQPWKFTKDQWEPEVWGRVLRKVGEQGLIYCTPDIPEEVFTTLPGVSGYEFLTPAGRKRSQGEEGSRKWCRTPFSTFTRLTK